MELTSGPVQAYAQEEKPLEDTVVKIYRCAKVVKGGRRFSFAALVVIGDRAGVVGIGYGKANEVPLAVEKGMKDAKKNLSGKEFDQIAEVTPGKPGAPVLKTEYYYPEGTVKDG